LEWDPEFQHEFELDAAVLAEVCSNLALTLVVNHLKSNDIIQAYQEITPIIEE